MVVKYFDAPGINAWQGLRTYEKNTFLLSGTAGDNGILNIGPITYDPKKNYTVRYPNTYSTSVYGPDAVKKGLFRLVGSYRLEAIDGVFGFIFQGSTKDLENPRNYSTVVTGGKYTYVHSTMGGLAVGNFDNPEDYGKYDLPLGPGNAFIYNVCNKKFVNIKYPGAITNTAYGIWYNGKDKCTICGGYALTPVSITDITKDGKFFKPIGSGYLVDYDAKTNKFSNWTTFNYPYGTNYETHFEGLSRSKSGSYQLSAVSIQSGGDINTVQGSWVEVSKDRKVQKWVNLNYNNDPKIITTSNSVAGNSVVGITLSDPVVAYQAVIE